MSRSMSVFEAERILGLEKPYTAEDAKSAHRKLLASNHPDAARSRGIPQDEAAEATKAINEALRTIRESLEDSDSADRKASAPTPEEKRNEDRYQSRGRPEPGRDRIQTTRRSSTPRGEEGASARQGRHTGKPGSDSGRPSHFDQQDKGGASDNQAAVQEAVSKMRQGAEGAFGNMGTGTGQEFNGAPRGQRPNMKSSPPNRNNQSGDRHQSSRSDASGDKDKSGESYEDAFSRWDDMISAGGNNTLAKMAKGVGKALVKILSKVFFGIIVFARAFPWVTLAIVVAILAITGVLGTG